MKVLIVRKRKSSSRCWLAVQKIVPDTIVLGKNENKVHQVNIASGEDKGTTCYCDSPETRYMTDRFIPRKFLLDNELLHPSYHYIGTIRVCYT